MVSSDTQDTPIVQPEQSQEPVQSQEPGQSPAPILTANVVNDGSTEAFMQVRPGDSWESIAEAAETTVDALYALNADMPFFSERSVQVGSYVRIA